MQMPGLVKRDRPAKCLGGRQRRGRDLSPLISSKPELGRLMCESLTEHIATEERVMIPPAVQAHASFSLVAWIEKEMKRFHDSIA